jgi:outer membrane protein TolC
VQLAREAWRVRRAAAQGIEEHQSAAKKLEAAGLIAAAERLKADVALDGARRDLSKAANDLEIAQVALSRLLASPGTVQPTTPLFVHSHPVGSLQSFIDTGMTQHPAWKKIESKREQADKALQLRGSEHSPSVFAVGNYNLNQSNDKLVQPNWFVGVYLSVPLVSHVDKAKMLEAARLDQARVQAAYEYVMALARLLEATGQPARLAELARSADLVLSPTAE